MYESNMSMLDAQAAGSGCTLPAWERKGRAALVHGPSEPLS